LQIDLISCRRRFAEDSMSVISPCGFLGKIKRQRRSLNMSKICKKDADKH
jgi:hypothetical protein